ncbi:MAG: NADH-quinone oxidoreductase subunit L [Thermoguttaceae bacterium]
MGLQSTLPLLLGLAWLLPLASFALILLFGPRMGRAGRHAASLATVAILTSLALSVTALTWWLVAHPLVGGHAEHGVPAPIVGDWYPLGDFGSLRITVGYYIDSLTLAMFCMVTLVASCIHVYSIGYMHSELSEVFDAQAPKSDGQPLCRRGRFCRFFQYLSLFCFSMLGLVLAGNAAMVFVFWELVGICSYLLIGFWHERRSASNAANKAFIVNRVGDFGMLIGLMALWAGLGTFSFNDIFQIVRPGADHALVVPPGMNYGLLVVAGLGIFCGCVGKSAQFPLHVWLPDAMEGPTPVSALIHAATMVAAGVYLVGRFYPIFTPEVLLVIASIGVITLFMAASIALVATDIKRVLAYSTVSQLGFMMLGLGVGGWLAGMFHLFTHAFFKSLLFLGSGSVIHACDTNEMPQMGGLRKKMPVTAYTMLVGCLAIAGAGIPMVIGLSGFYSKDCIIAQALSFRLQNPVLGGLFYYASLLGAGMTAFYMFRMWFLTFAGRPRDERVYAHAHESPRLMTVPLVILAIPAAIVAWSVPGTHWGLDTLLQQARPAGIDGASGGQFWPGVVMPAESVSHLNHAISGAAEWSAIGVALTGFLVAVAFYGLRRWNANDVRRMFSPIYWFLVHKWWFDELYAFLFVRPVLCVSRWVAIVDQRGIDWLVDGSARLVHGVAILDDWIDRLLVDSLVNALARRTYALGIRLRAIQTGSIRQYVVWIAVGVVGLFVLMSFYWNVTT